MSTYSLWNSRSSEIPSRERVFFAGIVLSPLDTHPEMRAAFTRELDSMTVDELTALKTMIDEKLQREGASRSPEECMQARISRTRKPGGSRKETGRVEGARKGCGRADGYL